MKKKNQLNTGLKVKERMSLRKRLLIVFVLFTGAMSTVYFVDARIQAANEEEYEEDYEYEEEYDEKTEKEFDKYKGDWYARIDDGVSDGLTYFLEYHIHINDVTKEDNELILRGDGYRSPTLDKSTLNTSLLSYPTDDEIPDVFKQYKNNGTMEKLFHFTNGDTLVYLKENKNESAKSLYWDADAQQKIELTRMTLEEVEDRKSKHEEWLATSEEEREKALSPVSEANWFIFGDWVGDDGTSMFTFNIQEISTERAIVRMTTNNGRDGKLAYYLKGEYYPDKNEIEFEDGATLSFDSETKAYFFHMDNAMNTTEVHLEKEQEEEELEQE